MMSLQLPHWFIIGGAALVAAGSMGLALRKTKAVEKDHPNEPTVKPREPMPPLPALLDSNRKRGEEKTGPSP
jgi:hypothetical protein